MVALRGGIVALAAVAIYPIAAGAADAPPIRVLPPECATAPVSTDDFVDALRVELAGRQPPCCVVGPGEPGAPDAVTVTLAIEPCEPATEQVVVVVDVAAPPRTVQRLVSLGDLPPEARPRALALAVAELIRFAGEPASEVPPPPPPLPAPPDTGPRPLAISGGIAGEARRHFSRDTTLVGARLAVSLSSARWQATIDAGAASNKTALALGDVSIFTATAGLFVGPRLVLGPFAASVGPTGALGWASIKGQSDMTNVTPGQGTALVGTVGLRVMVEGPASSLLRVYGYAEAGETVSSFDANVAGIAATGIAGFYITLAAGLHFGPAS
jgi:hypothetical protein